MLLETDPRTVRRSVVMMLRMGLHWGPTALLCWAALVRKGA